MAHLQLRGRRVLFAVAELLITEVVQLVEFLVAHLQICWAAPQRHHQTATGAKKEAGTDKVGVCLIIWRAAKDQMAATGGKANKRGKIALPASLRNPMHCLQDDAITCICQRLAASLQRGSVSDAPPPDRHGFRLGKQASKYKKVFFAVKVPTALAKSMENWRFFCLPSGVLTNGLERRAAFSR